MTADLKTQIHDFAAEFAADLPSVDVESITSSHETDQMISLVLRPKRRWRSWAVPALAALLVVVVIGGAALLFANRGGNDVADPLPAPTVVVPTVVEDVAPEPSPPTTLLPEAVEPSAPITGMVWQQVTPDGIDPTTDAMTALVNGGDRFLYLDDANKAISTSFDGINWTRRSIQGSVDGINDFVGWQDTIVGFGCGGWVGVAGSARITPRAGCVSVIRADGTVVRHSFDAQINGAGIGASGMVVIVTDNYDENGLQYATKDEMAESLTSRDINDFGVVELIDGVLHLETFDGQVSDYVISDHGYTDSESQFAGEGQVASGWFSQDGEEWIPIPDFPAGGDWDLIGTEDGFIAIFDTSVWHSSNGLDWRELGQSPDEGTLSRWREGAIVVGEEGVWYLSGLGIAETPLATTGLEPFISTSANVGVVIVDIEGETIDLNQILYSPNGQTWINTSVPPEMGDIDLTWSAFHYPVDAAATDTGVLLLLNMASDSGDSSTLVWFLGTPTTD